MGSQNLWDDLAALLEADDEVSCQDTYGKAENHESEDYVQRHTEEAFENEGREQPPLSENEPMQKEWNNAKILFVMSITLICVKVALDWFLYSFMFLSYKKFIFYLVCK